MKNTANNTSHREQENQTQINTKTILDNIITNYKNHKDLSQQETLIKDFFTFRTEKITENTTHTPTELRNQYLDMKKEFNKIHNRRDDFLLGETGVEKLPYNILEKHLEGQLAQEFFIARITDIRKKNGQLATPEHMQRALKEKYGSEITTTFNKKK